ncbi:uncharacterized protein K452DRAFT_192626, partial [Aplosporella prunicola CBS 121167]
AACVKGFQDIALILLKHRADFNPIHPEYGSAFYSACKGGYFDIVNELINQKVPINKCSGPSNSYALHAACYEGHNRIVDLLISTKKIKLNVQGGLYHHTLPAACHGCEDSTIKLLLERGCGHQKGEAIYNRALYEAVLVSKCDMVKLLIHEHGARASARS